MRTRRKRPLGCSTPTSWPYTNSAFAAIGTTSRWITSRARTFTNCARRIRSTPARAARYVKTIAEAIHYAHGQGVLHRDLKPSNVLIDQFDQPRITDFGLAKSLATDAHLTLSGQTLGTPQYIPPEQASIHHGLAGPWSDVYSIGGILYHLLTGRPPFVAGHVGDVLQQVLFTTPSRRAC